MLVLKIKHHQCLLVMNCPLKKIFIYVPLCYVKASQQNKCHKKLWCQIKFILLMQHENLQDNLTSMTLFLMLFPVVHLNGKCNHKTHVSKERLLLFQSKHLVILFLFSLRKMF